MITHVGGDGRPAANIRSQHLWGGLGCALVIICPINSVSSLPHLHSPEDISLLVWSKRAVGCFGVQVFGTKP